MDLLESSRVSTPPEVTSIQLPTLPASFADAQPAAADYMGYDVQLIAIPGGTVTDYNAFRAIPEAQTTCASCAVERNLIPRVIFSEI